jgi:hypothetical protein
VSKSSAKCFKLYTTKVEKDGHTGSDKIADTVEMSIEALFLRQKSILKLAKNLASITQIKKLFPLYI